MENIKNAKSKRGLANYNERRKAGTGAKSEASKRKPKRNTKKDAIPF